MGIISKQSSRTSIISFIGVAVGALSVMFVYPYDRNLYGYLQYLFSYANLLSLLLSFGSMGLIVKYFPVFTSKKIPGFFLTVMTIIAVTLAATTAILLLLKPAIYRGLETLDFNLNVITQSQTSIYLLAVILVFITSFSLHASNFNKTVVPTILYEFLHKLALPGLILASFFQITDVRSTGYLYVLFWLLVFMLFLSYLKKIKALELTKPVFSKISPGLKKEMVIFMLYSGLNQMGSNLVSRIDMVMIAVLISFTDNGTYGILLFMANIIDIPIRSINQIASPIVSRSMETKDMENVDQVYKKSSINALIFGIFIFILMWAILPDLFEIMPRSEDMINYIWVFFFLGLGKLVDMAFSINGFIIIYSKYYKYNLLFLSILALLNIILNYWLIREYGILGAAGATAFSIACFNIVKLIFIRKKLKLWPFTKTTLIVVLLGLFTLILGILIPSSGEPFLNIVLKSSILTSVYYFGLKWLNVQAEALSELEKAVLFIYKRTFKK